MRFLAMLLLLFSTSFVSAQTTITIGDTNVESTPDSGNGNLMFANRVTLNQPATIASLAFDITQASGSLYLALFDSAGVNGAPLNLLAATPSFTAVRGFTPRNVVTQRLLPIGTYWLVVFASSGNLAFVKQNNSGACMAVARPFSSGLPTQWPAGGFDCTPTTWSLYATLTIGGGGGGGAGPVTATVISSSEIDLSWQPVAGAAAYDVYRNGVKIATVTTTTYKDMGLSPSTQYTYTIDVVGPQSSPTTATTLASAPPVNGQCGAAQGVPSASAPSSGLCLAGTPTIPVSDGTNWNWTCNGSNGGSSATCSAPVSAITTPPGSVTFTPNNTYFLDPP